MTEKAIARIEEDVKIIKIAIIGDVENEDKIGIKGHLALVRQSLGRAWWFIGVITVVIFATAGFAIRSVF